MEWVAEGIGGNAANGVTAGDNFLQTGKDINLVVGINDGGCLGVLEAFNAAGYGGDKVGISAGDATNDALNAVKEGGIYRGTVTTGLVSLAPDFIDLAVKLAQGEAVDRENLGPTTLITCLLYTSEPGKTCGHCEFCRTGRYNLCPDVVFFATPPVDGVVR